MHTIHEHTRELTDVIREAIANNPRKAISFRDYMEMCLYHEPLGYYNRESVKVGKQGDFYTSASIGTIMGETLAAMFARIAAKAGTEKPLTIVEWGGGTGRMAGAVLDALAERAPATYRRLEYRMVERSPYHRAQQRRELARHESAIRQVEPERFIEENVSGEVIVFSNELLDAFPVHRVECKQGELYEWHVGWNEAVGTFVVRLEPLEPDGAAAAYLARQHITVREGQVVEACPEAADWIRRVGRRMKRGTLVTIDYGDSAEELTGPHRMRGTFLCYRRHQAYDEPFAFPGEQDMTAHVNFTACIRAGEEAGFTGWSLRTQRQFLLDEGAMDMLVAHDGRDPFGPAARRNRAVRQLLVDDRMGELFKVLVQTK